MIDSTLRKTKRFWKYSLSFLSKDWQLRDYPVTVRPQGDAPTNPSSRFKTYPWVARIGGWGVLSGTGNTRDEALANLAANFDKEKSKRVAKGEPLPRPGTSVPIQFAPSGRIAAHSELSADFTHLVLLLPWAFLSDESSLWHFHEGDSNEHYIQRIREVYDVDCSDIADAPIADILDRIAEHQQSRQ